MEKNSRGMSLYKVQPVRRWIKQQRNVRIQDAYSQEMEKKQQRNATIQDATSQKMEKNQQRNATTQDATSQKMEKTAQYWLTHDQAHISNKPHDKMTVETNLSEEHRD